jgi:NAD(P)-dependent dehydrogenase (short-subunit alcohol dehydrogenase family)
MNITLKDKVVVITGGSRGIGEAMVNHFKTAKAIACNLDLNEGDTDADYYLADVSKGDQMHDAIDQIVEKYGHIDILINNAGIAHVGNIENTSEADLDRLYNINIKGVYNGTIAAIPYMKKQMHGVIINMASVASVIGLPDRFAYSMTKAAVENMTYTVARDYVDYNIRCNCISPGRVHTPFVDQFIAKNYPGKEKEMFDKLAKTQPIGRMGQADEIAKLAIYLASDEASFITGTNFPIDGGFVKLNT